MEVIKEWNSSSRGNKGEGRNREEPVEERKFVSQCIAVFYQMTTSLSVQQEERFVSRLLFLFAQKLNNKLLSSKLIKNLPNQGESSRRAGLNTNLCGLQWLLKMQTKHRTEQTNWTLL